LLFSAGRITVARETTLAPQQSLLDQLLGWLGVLPAPAEAKAMEGNSVNLQFSPAGLSLYRTRAKITTTTRSSQRIAAASASACLIRRPPVMLCSD
jgi:hypothetical protein